MPKERFGAIFVNGQMIDLDEASLLKLRNISDELKEQEIAKRRELEKILMK